LILKEEKIHQVIQALKKLYISNIEPPQTVPGVREGTINYPRNMLSNRRSIIPAATDANPRLSYQARRASFGVVNTANTEPHYRTPSIITSTTSELPGYYVVNVIGAIYGSSTILRKDTKSLSKGVYDGTEAKGLTHMLYDAKDQSIQRMVIDCITSGGNAIIDMKFEQSEIFGIYQCSGSGTAVYVQKRTDEIL
jgi:uncharacterized protein YbjQ (UPF0145 family)